MSERKYLLAAALALATLAACSEPPPTASPAPCAAASAGEWEFLGLQADSIWYIRAVAVDPRDPTRILAGTNSDFLKGLPGRLFLSEDDGASWQQVLLSGRHVTDGLFDVASSGTAYATTSEGVYKSTDGGHSWAFTSPGICTDSETSILFLRQATNGVLYAGTNGNVGGCPFTIYRSSDGGESWVDLCKGKPGCLPNGPFELAIDPSNPLRLLAGLNFEFGMQESTDGGESWTTNGYEQPGAALGIAIDFPDPSVIYAGHRHGGSSVSEDGGATWTLFNEGLPKDAAGEGLVQDPISHALFLLAEETLWLRHTSNTSWKEWPIYGEQLFRGGGLIVSPNRYLYVGSFGLWRRDLTTIPSTESGPCGP